jgi:hypothetical protein
MPVRRNYILEGWNLFAQKVLGPVSDDPAKERVRVMLRRAFYAGADVLMVNILTHLTAGPDPQEADVTMLSDIEAEIKEFAEMLKQGRA